MNNIYVRDLWVGLTGELYSWTSLHNLATRIQRNLTPVYGNTGADYINGKGRKLQRLLLSYTQPCTQGVLQRKGERGGDAFGIENSLNFADRRSI